MSDKKNKYSKRLYRLSELKDFEVAKGDEDIRGWDVISGDDRTIGKVDELIVDPVARKVRYIDVEVDEEIGGGNEQGHILIPIGAAALDSKKDIVYAGNIQTITMLQYPRTGAEISREYETSVRDLLGDKAQLNDEKFYENDLYNENRFYSSRSRLQRLSDLGDRKIMNSDPDVRRWKVVSKDGLILGKVNDLIADPAQRRIRYLDVVVDAKDPSVDHNVLVPIGLASLDSSEDKVIVNIEKDALLKLPVYDGRNITREYENSLRETARLDTMTTASPDNEDDYYSREYFDDQGFYGARGKGVRWI
jgi:sporulation protein YlmC with PRC-barrel domain